MAGTWLEPFPTSGYLAQLIPVRLAWASTMSGGKFKGRQPESLTPEEWCEILASLTGAKP